MRRKPREKKERKKERDWELNPSNDNYCIDFPICYYTCGYCTHLHARGAGDEIANQRQFLLIVVVV